MNGTISSNDMDQIIRKLSLDKKLDKNGDKVQLNMFLNMLETFVPGIVTNDPTLQEIYQPPDSTSTKKDYQRKQQIIETYDKNDPCFSDLDKHFVKKKHLEVLSFVNAAVLIYNENNQTNKLIVPRDAKRNKIALHLFIKHNLGLLKPIFDEMKIIEKISN